MASIRKEISTKASLEDVWAALRDVGALQPCSPAALQSCIDDLSGRRISAVPGSSGPRNTPMYRTVLRCCARDATGQDAAAAPPRTPRNFRRRMPFPKLRRRIVIAQIGALKAAGCGFATAA